MIIYQSREEYIKECPRPWYSFISLPRGYTDYKDIYINQDAFFISKRDKRLLIEHEQGHIAGLIHTWLGLMSPYGIIRYLTTW